MKNNCRKAPQGTITLKPGEIVKRGQEIVNAEGETRKVSSIVSVWAQKNGNVKVTITTTKYGNVAPLYTPARGH
jgi:hypothetical protein